MNTSTTLGIDIGTSSVKAGLCLADGSLAGLATESLPLARGADGSVTQDMEEIYLAAARVVRTLVERQPDGALPPLAMAVSGQMAGVGLVDAAHRPVAPYDSWLDSRCSAVLDGVSSALAAAILAKAGCAPTVSMGPKLAWWSRFQPDSVSRVAKAVTLAGYVAGRAAGLAGEEAVIDPSYLHFAAVADTAQGLWDEALADALGVPFRWLPRIVRSETVIGHLTAEGAATFGLPVGLPIAAGCGDTAAAVVGAGVLSHGQAFDVAGTAAVFGVRVSSFAADPSGTLLTMRSPLSPGCLRLAYVGGGGELIAWLVREVLGHGELDQAGYADLEHHAARAQGGELLMSPHFSGRVCPAAPTMRGALIGLTPGSSRGEMARAAMEAIAFEYRGYLDASQALEPPATGVAGSRKTASGAVTGMGGGARLSFWNQLKADALGLPYRPLLEAESGVRGIATVAAASQGVAVPPPSSDAFGPVSEPRPNARLDDRYRRYRRWTDVLARQFDLEQRRPGGPERSMR
jgi:xylulokinase